MNGNGGSAYIPNTNPPPPPPIPLVCADFLGEGGWFWSGRPAPLLSTCYAAFVIRILCFISMTKLAPHPATPNHTLPYELLSAILWSPRAESLHRDFTTYNRLLAQNTHRFSLVVPRLIIVP